MCIRDRNITGFNGLDFVLEQGVNDNNVTLVLTTAVPEPGSLVILGCLGVVGMARRRRRFVYYVFSMNSPQINCCEIGLALEVSGHFNP